MKRDPGDGKAKYMPTPAEIARPKAIIRAENEARGRDRVPYAHVGRLNGFEPSVVRCELAHRVSMPSREGF